MRSSTKKTKLKPTKARRKKVMLESQAFLLWVAEYAAASCGDEGRFGNNMSAEPTPYIKTRPDTSQLAARSGLFN